MPLDFTGRSDVSSQRTTGPGYSVRNYGINTDQFKVMPEIMYRAYHQQQQLQQPRTAAPSAAPRMMAAAPAATPRSQGYKNLMGGIGGESELPYEVQMQLLALQREDERRRNPEMEATYVKPSYGFNMGGGNRPAQAWEPGAVASGYMRRGEAPHPSQAQFIDSRFPSRAQLSEEAPTPPRFDPSMYGVNPWATRGAVAGGPGIR